MQEPFCASQIGNDPDKEKLQFKIFFPDIKADSSQYINSDSNTCDLVFYSSGGEFIPTKMET